MSHFSLWEESVRTNERIMVLEHDGMFETIYVIEPFDSLVNIKM